MQTYDDIAGVEVWPIGLPDVLVTIARDEPPPASPAVLAEWDALCRVNPRLYDGPILSVKTVDIEHAHVHVSRDRYSRLAVFPRVRTGARLLAVTGLLLAKDGGGRQYVLLGKRGDQVSRYPGCWEFGPSGGMAVPAPTTDRFGMEFIGGHLRDEISEELGLDRLSCELTPIAYARDHAVMSDDIVLRCDLGTFDDNPIAAVELSWEYTEVRWIPIDSVSRFV
ncbi:MAG: hypothetical protein ACOYN0_19040, partial [Phycisphaerales bacterium]